jgi:hypothetical protein
MTHRLIVALVLSTFSSLVSVRSASASPLLITDTSTMNNFTFRPANGPLGIGQGVSVATTYVLDHFDMMLLIGGPGHLKFMIWDGTNSTLLYSGTETVSTPGPNAVWVSSPPLAFTIIAGNTYFFGVIADNGTTLAAPDWFLPPYTTTQNGLTLLKAFNSNYFDFADPQYFGDGSVTFPLRIFGDLPAPTDPDPPPGPAASVAVPEPSTLALLGLAVCIGAIIRRGLHRSVRPISI